MNNLIDEILEFLKSNGFDCSVRMRHDFYVIYISSDSSQFNRTILPLDIMASTCEEAMKVSERTEEAIRQMSGPDEGYPLIITQDRWNRQRQLMQTRILAHLEIFSPIYARNCEVRRIDKSVAKAFLKANHSYGHAACRYCYGMFLKRHTGHIARQDSPHIPGTLVAVATFSNARKWTKGGQTIRSYEWTRYASLPDVRLSGGMGRMLKTFVNEVSPDDIMSYADLEWSAGEVYRQLGFALEGRKEAVLFSIDKDTWERIPVRTSMEHSEQEIQAGTYFQNFGSNKYRLKLTDYE